MNCPICGTNNLENASLCVNCGRPLNASAPPPPPPPPPQSYTPPPPQGGYTPPSGGYVPPHTPNYGPGGPGVPGPAVPNYLIQSILVTLCCCLPLGIVAIIFAAQVNTKLAQGDVAGAQDASQKAKMFCWIGFGVGLVVTLIWFALSGAAFFEGMREAMANQ